MSFSWLLHLLLNFKANCPFFEHCIYYSEKATARQEKFFRNILIFQGFFHISTGRAVEKICRKHIFWYSMRPGLLYLVFWNTKYTILQRQKIFSVIFFIEPVDNFWYTYDRNVRTVISQSSQQRILCYPHIVDNTVDNFCKPQKIMLKTKRTKWLKVLKTQGFSPMGILWKKEGKFLCITQKSDFIPHCIPQCYPDNLWITIRRKTIEQKKGGT